MSVLAHPTPRPATDLDGLREALHGMWGSVAPSWADGATYVDARATGVTDAMLTATAPATGERLLELGCGPGGVGLASAPRLGPQGQVVLSDVSPEMVAIAAARVAASGLANITTAVLDLEWIEQPDASFDVVVCREALMLVPDPVGAVREAARVLRPGGRAAFAVWGGRDRNPWLGVLLDAVTAHTGMPVPPPGVPGPFSIDASDLLTEVLSDGGLADVAVSEIDNPMRVDSFDHWWALVPTLAGPISRIIASLPDDVRGAIRDNAQQALGRYAGAGGLVVPGLTLVGSGTRRCAFGH